MLTGEDDNGIRMSEGSRESQRESHGHQGIDDEIRRRGWFVEIDAFQSLGRASLECAIEAVRQKGQRHRSRACGFANVEFWQQLFGLVGNVMGLRDRINVKSSKLRTYLKKERAADSEFFNFSIFSIL